MLDDEVKQLLRELAQATGAPGTSVVHEEPSLVDPNVRVAPLGSGVFLRVNVPSPSARARFGDADHLAQERERHDLVLAESMERCARALRACARRWGVARVPVCTLSESVEPPGGRIRERIRVFLHALAVSNGADLALITVRRRIEVENEAASELYRERVPFIIRRVDVEAERRRTSHGELVGDDFYALSFWFDACLVAFFSRPFALDFVRHRARLVVRELAPLLAMLDDPPPAPAIVAPIPE